MSLKVLTAASTANLIGLATVKARLGILSTDTSKDALLQAYIAGVSSDMAYELGRAIGRQSYQESVAGNRRRVFFLTAFPLDADSVSLVIEGVATANWAIAEAANGALYRAVGWPPAYNALNTNTELNVVVNYKAGYILPDQIVTWASGLTLAVGSWVRPSSPSLSPYLFEVTTSGLTSGSEPSWPATTGLTVASGAVTFTVRDAVELPAFVVDLAWLAIFDRYNRLTRPAGLLSQSADGFSETYAPGDAADGGGLPKAVCEGLARLRYAA